MFFEVSLIGGDRSKFEETDELKKQIDQQIKRINDPQEYIIIMGLFKYYVLRIQDTGRRVTMKRRCMTWEGRAPHSPPIRPPSMPSLFSFTSGSLLSPFLKAYLFRLALRHCQILESQFILKIVRARKESPKFSLSPLSPL